MSDTSPSDCPFHVLLERLSGAEGDRKAYQANLDQVNELHALDNQFTSADLRARLVGTTKVYADSRNRLRVALDAVLDELEP